MEYKDYYKILGVDKNASAKEIKQAYRRLARKYHPDVNPGDKGAEDRFKEINEAHEVLTDPEKRRKYDQLGSSWQQWQRMGRDPGGFDWGSWYSPGTGQVHVEYGDFSDLFGGGGFSEFFESLFGGIGRSPGVGGQRSYRARPRRGRDYEQPVDITLEEAFQGTKRTIHLDGRRLEVKVPPGVKTGSKVRMAGEGGEGVGGGAKGDLFLKINVLPHATFERKGSDLHCQVDVGLYTAVLGGEIVVPTLKGRVSLKIPPETQSGRSFRLSGQGMPHLRDPEKHGDLYAKVKVVLPKNLSEAEKKLFRQLATMREER